MVRAFGSAAHVALRPVERQLQRVRVELGEVALLDGLLVADPAAEVVSEDHFAAARVERHAVLGALALDDVGGVEQRVGVLEDAGGGDGRTHDV